jgi:hypothetical protein
MPSFATELKTLAPKLYSLSRSIHNFPLKGAPRSVPQRFQPDRHVLRVYSFEFANFPTVEPVSN